ncbi:MAG: hypothetical protein RQM92_07365 [Candidatus Syntrophopropionicum ammoniitolerans]
MATTVKCRIKNACCNEVSRSKPDASGRSNVTFAIVVDYMLRVVDGEGHVIKRFNDLAFSFTKTVLLCAPEGLMTNCEIVNATCGPCLILCNLISCTFDLCIVIQSVAIVKILVPAMVSAHRHFANRFPQKLPLYVHRNYSHPNVHQ